MPNELDVGGIVMRIRADASGVLAGVKQLETAMAQMRSSTDKAGAAVEKSAAQETKAVQGAADATMKAGKQVGQAHEQMGNSAENAAAMQTAAYAAIAAGAYKMTNIILGAVDAGINAMNRYRTSLIGLQAVAEGKGINSDALLADLDKVVDSFFDASAAATSFRNLLSRGYSLEQATQVVARLKDAAATGKQASMTLAQAVQSATEGLKNEMSILVDNAGVTKNVSIMWKEYAAQIGVGVDSLTQAQKVQAEYNGIMAETEYMVGNLVKVQQTLAGTQAEAAMSGELLSRSYGEAMAPAVGLVTEGLILFQNTLRGAAEMFPGFTAGMTTGTVALLALVVTIPAGAIALEQLKIKFAEATASATIFGISVKAAMPWLLGLTAIIGLATWAYTDYIKAQEAAVQAARETAQAEKERLKGLQNEVSELGSLDARYRELSGKKKLTYSETKELYQIEQTLAGQYGITVTSLEGVAGAYSNVTKAIQDKISANEAELQKQRELDAANAKTAADAAQNNANVAEETKLRLLNDRTNLLEEIAKAEVELAKAENAMRQAGSNGAEIEPWINQSKRSLDGLIDSLAKLDNKIANEELIQSYATEAWGLSMIASIEKIKSAIGADEETENLAQAFVEKFWEARAFAGFESATGAQEFAEKMISGFRVALDSADITPAKTAVDGFLQSVLGGGKLTENELETFSLSFEQLIEGANKIGEALGMSAKDVERYFSELYPELAAFNFEIDEWYAKMSEFDAAAFASKSLSDKKKAIDDITKEAKAASTEYGRLSDAMAESNEKIDALESMKKHWAQQDSDSFKAAKEYAEDAYDKQFGGIESVNTQLDEEKRLQADLIAQWQFLTDSYADTVGTMAAMRDVFGEGSEEAAILDEAMLNLYRDFIAINRAANAGWSFPDFDPVVASADEYQKQVLDITKAATKLQEKMDLTQTAAKNAADWKKIIQAAKQGKASQEDYNKVLSQLGLAAGTSYDTALSEIDKYGSALNDSISSIQQEAQGLATKLYTLMAAANQRGDIQINTSQAQTAISGLTALLTPLVALMKAAGFAPASSSSGGGGGASAYQKAIDAMEHEADMERMSLEKQLATLVALDAKFRNRKGKSTLSLDDQRDLEKRIFDIQEEIRKENLDNAYDALDHKKALNQVTLEDELNLLEQIKEAHQLNAEELADIEERLYDTRQAIRERDSQSLDTLAQGIVTALQARYEAMQEAEIERLDASREAWHKWADDSVAAIQAQIDALDDLADTEDREAQDAKELRKITSLQEQITYEQDAYNRAQLQAQLEKAIADREARLRKLSLQDQKDALKDQIDAIKDKAQQEQDAIDKEQTDIEKAYAERMKAAALQAEAERMLMAESQENILALISQYAEDYNATGKSLGEQWLDGFMGAAGSIENWFNSFNARIEEIQAQIAQTALQASENFYSAQAQRQAAANQAASITQSAPVTVKQENNFYQPIESPADAARRIQRVNEALVRDLL